MDFLVLRDFAALLFREWFKFFISVCRFSICWASFWKLELELQPLDNFERFLFWSSFETRQELELAKSPPFFLNWRIISSLLSFLPSCGKYLDSDFDLLFSQGIFVEGKQLVIFFPSSEEEELADFWRGLGVWECSLGFWVVLPCL